MIISKNKRDINYLFLKLSDFNNKFDDLTLKINAFMDKCFKIINKNKKFIYRTLKIAIIIDGLDEMNLEDYEKF